jgi:hypothetical protein
MNEMLQVRYSTPSVRPNGSRASRTIDRNVSRRLTGRSHNSSERLPQKKKAGELAFSGLSALVG